MIKPTEEQHAALAVFNTGQHLVLEAGAGTGKTSTLRLLAGSTVRKGIYVAYNKAVAVEAAASFPSNVSCRTAHSLAYAAVGHKYRPRMDNQRRQPWATTANKLGVDGKISIRDHTFDEGTLARLAMEMVGNFCNSADPEITEAHVPFIDGLRGLTATKEYYDDHPVLASVLLPVARHAWQDLQGLTGVAPFDFDHYLKMWQLGNPKIKADFILFDEAQDANPVIADVVARQKAQRVYVGDRAQAIYGWRGAIDAMTDIEGERRLLSQSFRFGAAIADEANAWLARLNTPLRLKGSPSVQSCLEDLENPEAILCRTNAGQVEALLDCQELGLRSHIVGGTKDLARFTEGAQDLQAGRKSSHRDLMAFDNWSDVQRYAKEDGGTFATWVNLIDSYTPPKVLKALGLVVPELDAHVTISTAHKAKGREWSSVRIHDDFTAINNDGQQRKLAEPELMLRYVAVTRARHRLDATALAVGTPQTVPAPTKKD